VPIIFKSNGANGIKIVDFICKALEIVKRIWGAGTGRLDVNNGLEEMEFYLTSRGWSTERTFTGIQSSREVVRKQTKPVRKVTWDAGWSGQKICVRKTYGSRRKILGKVIRIDWKVAQYEVFLANTFAIRYRPSVCLSSVTLVHPTQPVEIFGNISTDMVPLPPIYMHRQFYGDRPRGTPPPGELTQEG